MDSLVEVQLTVVCSSQEQTVRTLEALSRAAAGFCFDGMDTNVHLLQFAEEDEDEEVEHE